MSSTGICSRRRRVGPSRIRWDRVGRIALVLVLFGVMVSYLNPLVNLLEAWQGSKSSESQLAQLKQERVDLTGQLRDASSPATLEREARRLGMVQAGRARLRRARAPRGLTFA